MELGREASLLDRESPRFSDVPVVFRVPLGQPHCSKLLYYGTLVVVHDGK